MIFHEPMAWDSPQTDSHQGVYVNIRGANDFEHLFRSLCVLCERMRKITYFAQGSTRDTYIYHIHKLIGKVMTFVEDHGVHAVPCHIRLSYDKINSKFGWGPTFVWNEPAPINDILTLDGRVGNVEKIVYCPK